MGASMPSTAALPFSADDMRGAGAFESFVPREQCTRVSERSTLPAEMPR